MMKTCIVYYSNAHQSGFTSLRCLSKFWIWTVHTSMSEEYANLFAPQQDTWHKTKFIYFLCLSDLGKTVWQKYLQKILFTPPHCNFNAFNLCPITCTAGIRMNRFYLVISLDFGTFPHQHLDDLNVATACCNKERRCPMLCYKTFHDFSFILWYPGC